MYSFHLPNLILEGHSCPIWPCINRNFGDHRPPGISLNTPLPSDANLILDSTNTASFLLPSATARSTDAPSTGDTNEIAHQGRVRGFGHNVGDYATVVCINGTETYKYIHEINEV